MKEEKIEQAELFVLDPKGFKKVTIVPMNRDLYYADVVYLSHGGKKSRLRCGTYVSKDSGDRCKIVEQGFIDWEHCFGVIIKEEMLKPKD